MFELVPVFCACACACACDGWIFPGCYLIHELLGSCLLRLLVNVRTHMSALPEVLHEGSGREINKA